MITTDGVLWKRDTNYPTPVELRDMQTPVLHKCSWDSEPFVMNEGSEHFEARGVAPWITDFICTHCGQTVRISFKLWRDIAKQMTDEEKAKAGVRL